YALDARDANSARLVRIDIPSGKSQLIAADADYDVAHVTLHPDTRQVQMVGFVRSRLEWNATDPVIAPDMAAIRELNDGDFGITDRTDADDTWLVTFDRDT